MNPVVFLLPFFDVATLMLSSPAVFYALPKFGEYNPADYQLLTVMLMSIALLGFVASGSYQSFLRGEWRRSVQRAWGTWCVLFVAVVVVLFAIKTPQHFSRLWLFVWWFSGLMVIALVRRYAYVWSIRRYQQGRWLKKVLLISDQDGARRMDRVTGELLRHGYKVISTHILNRGENPSEAFLANLENEASSGQYTEVWLSFPLAREVDIEAIASVLVLTPLSVRIFPDLTHLDLINLNVGKVGPLPYMSLSSSDLGHMALAIKWAEDFFLSLIALIVLSPLMSLIALGVKLSSPGPVFYRQVRVGLNGRNFSMLKFRSMRTDFETQGVVWGNAAQKPITAFGQFLRSTSLDELPQLLNVLRGDMSLVGPRPERPEFVEQFKSEIPLYMKKHLVKAGITGWAQIHGYRGDTDLNRRIQYDLYYIRNWSLWLDLKIMFLTLFALLSGD